MIEFAVILAVYITAAGVWGSLLRYNILWTIKNPKYIVPLLALSWPISAPVVYFILIFKDIR